MIDTKVYINGDEVDVNDDFRVLLTYSVADIREPEKRSTTWSKTAIAPGTQKNNKFFGHIWKINASINSSGTVNFNPYFNPNLKADAVITKKGTVIFEGIAQLLNINVLDNYEVEYEIAFVGQLTNIIQVTENRTLAEIDLSEYDHTYTRQNQINSWATSIVKNGANYPFTLGEGYVYPMIDYGYNNNADWNVKHFFTAVYLKTVTDKIISGAGFEYVSNFMDSERYRRFIIPCSGGSNLKLTNDQVEDRTFRATSSGVTYVNKDGSTTPEVIDIADDSTPPNFDTGGVYNNITGIYTVPYSGTYTFRIKPKASVTHFPSADTTLATTIPQMGWFRIVKSGVGVMTSILTRLSSVGYIPSTFTITMPSSTVTSGTTTDTQTGDLSITTWAYAGDQIYCDFLPSNTTAYATGANSPTNYARINIEVGTIFSVQMSDTNVQENDVVSLSSILPDKYKQSDLLKSVIKAFNLFVQQDKDNPRKLYIEPRDDFYADGEVVDWSQKLDNTKEVRIIPMGELNTKRYIFKYKDDEDYYNRDYRAEYSETYGQHILDIENDFLKGEIKNEIIFSPTPLVDHPGNDRIISRIFDIDDQATVKPKPSNIRLLYYGGVKTTNSAWNYIASSGTTVMSEYAYAGHVDDPLNPTFDLSFGVPREVYYLTDTYTANNLFNIYHKEQYDQITDKNSKILVAYFHLNEIDINKLDFRNEFYFENEKWQLNKIYDYDSESSDTVKVDFLRLKTVAGFPQDTGVPIKGGYTQGVNLPLYNTRTLSNNSYGVKSTGEYNNLPGYGNVLVVGSNNSVGHGAENVVILGSSGVTVMGGLSNVTLINSDDIVVTESNVRYVNGVQIPIFTSHKKYVANLTQSGTGAPTVFVLENTLGGTLVWGYDGVGSYTATLAGAFPSQSSVAILLGQTYTTQTDEMTYAYWGDANTIYVETAVNNLSSNDVLNSCTIEIRVYN